MTQHYICKVSACLGSSDERERVLKGINEKFETETIRVDEKSFEITVFAEIANVSPSSSITDELESIFDKSKTLEGWLDLYTHIESRQVHS